MWQVGADGQQDLVSSHGDLSSREQSEGDHGDAFYAFYDLVSEVTRSDFCHILLVGAISNVCLGCTRVGDRSRLRPSLQSQGLTLCEGMSTPHVTTAGGLECMLAQLALEYTFYHNWQSRR